MAFGKLGQNFKPRDRVIIGNTGPNGLDGVTGIIGGITYENEAGSFYIVIADEPLPNGWLAVTIVESCLARI